jgi:D-serine deaminase-like pyridoxal phosphate-dependent protein
MVGANQEHGILAWTEGRSPAEGGDLAQRLPLGTLVRILPNHACATAAQFGHYEVLMADGTLARWPRFNGW